MLYIDMLLHYNPNQIGLLNCRDDGVNDALRYYEVLETIDMISVDKINNTILVICDVILFTYNICTLKATIC